MIKWTDDDETTEAAEYAGVLRAAQGTLSWIALAANDSDDPPDEWQNDFVASSAVVDRYGDVIDQQTWILKHYRRNPVVLYEHGMSIAHGTLVVGRSAKVGITQLEDGTKQLRSRIQWDVGEHNPVATMVAIQHKLGFRSAVSVGFKPHEAKSRTELDPSDPLYVDGTKTPRWKAGHVFRHNELYEISPVAVPGNQDALQLAAEIRGAEDIDTKIRSTVRDLLPGGIQGAMITALQRSAAVRQAVLVAVMSGEPDRPTQHDDPVVRWLTNT